MEPKTSGTTSTPAPSAMESDSVKLATELPAKHGPLGRQHRSMQVVKEVFQTVEPLRRATRLTVAAIRPLAGNSRFSAVLASQCDLEILKVFVASDWAPAVVITSPVGPKHVRAVVGYDDIAEIVILTDPMNYAKQRIKYSDFLKQWDDPRKSCVLISSRRVSVDIIKSTLRIYLTEEKADSVIIKTSRKQ